jgi:hypothetical protein
MWELCYNDKHILATRQQRQISKLQQQHLNESKNSSYDVKRSENIFAITEEK